VTASQPNHRLIAAVFIALVGTPLLASVARIGTATPASESATAEDRPSTAGGWVDYFDAHFGFRTQLLHVHALVSARLLRVSPSPSIIRGREGWLYYADDSSIEDYESAAPMTNEELESWRASLVATRDALRARGIAYVFAIAPDKHVIYPEYLPASIHRLRQPYRMDELLADLRAHTDLTIVDFRPGLLARKPIERVYAMTDTHWNDRGAFVGYDALMRAASGLVPRIAPLPRAAFQDRERDERGGDLAEMIGLADTFREHALLLDPRSPRRARLLEPTTLREGYEVARVVTELPDRSLPRVLVFRDSFMTQLIPFVSEHFSRAVYLWQNDVDFDVVAAEKPALVIQEIVGRRLQDYTP
jgi:alginate O-acetyltransferase complex protein AlgJ